MIKDEGYLRRSLSSYEDGKSVIAVSPYAMISESFVVAIFCCRMVKLLKTAFMSYSPNCEG